MSWTGDLLTGLAAYLAAGSVGTWQPSGAYPTDADAPIFIGDMPATPHRLIVLTAYPVSDDPSLSDSTVGVQVRTRGAKGSQSSVDDLDDAVFDRLHGIHGLDLSTGLHIAQMHRQSGAPMGIDGNRRHGRVSNFYALVHRPSPHRL